MSEEQAKEEQKPEMPEEKPKEPEKPVEEPKPEMPEEPAKPAEEPSEKKPMEKDVVFIGKKPAMNYVLAVTTQFADEQKIVHIKARGRNISRAVDVAEIVRNKFIKDVSVQTEIGTEQIVDEQTKKSLGVSTIDIALEKKG